MALGIHPRRELPLMRALGLAWPQALHARAYGSLVLGLRLQPRRRLHDT
jgi:hypothetical protein